MGEKGIGPLLHPNPARRTRPVHPPAGGYALPMATRPSISDAAVTRATGRPWVHWFKLLDRFDVRQHGHAAAAAHLHKAHESPPWWSQMIVVEYERARGLRARHQTPTGFTASASKTLPVPLARLYAAWRGRALHAWLPESRKPGFRVRKANRHRSIRFDWPAGGILEVNFSDKTTKSGVRKAGVAVQQNKLPNAAAVTRAKKFWKAALARLAASLAA